jgi:2-oxoglutarate dehydrogenase E1 component
VGVEYMHIPNVEQCNWIRARVEKNVFTSSADDNNLWAPSKEEKLATLDQLISATQLEEFLQSKFNEKRYARMKE